MCVIKVLNPQILCSTGIFTVTQRMYSMYLFSVFFFLGMPDKESMSSSALCQVSKNCSKVNHTQFCLFFCWRGRNLVMKNVELFNIQLKITECKCKACGWFLWVQYTNYKNALDILSFNWRKHLVQDYYKVYCYQKFVLQSGFLVFVRKVLRVRKKSSTMTRPVDNQWVIKFVIKSYFKAYLSLNWCTGIVLALCSG